MYEPPLKIDVKRWVERAKDDPVAYLQRQATEIILNAIALSADLNEGLYLKGGVLMGLVYASPRQTTDIDLTAGFPATADDHEKIREYLDNIFPAAAAGLGYTDLILKTQSIQRKPRNDNFETANFPALKLKIAFAKRDSNQAKSLAAGICPDVIEVDISFNEPTQKIQLLSLTGGNELRAYSLVDLIAEKYRAMLQQVTRNRERRQDVYDLDILIKDPEIDAACRKDILEAFIEKCETRDITPNRASLDDPEIRKRSSANWHTLELELGHVPEFDDCFQRVSEFYRSLPWPSATS